MSSDSFITHNKAEISAMADYCDPDLMLITEIKLDSSTFSSELLTKVTWESLEGIAT